MHLMRLKLRHLERIVWLLENSVRIPFTRWRIGLDPILGLVPWLGDAIAAAVSTLLLLAAAQSRVPFVILVRIALNIAADFLIGLVPVVGDVCDIFFRSNRRNIELLRTHIDGAGRPRLVDHAIAWGLILGLALALGLGAWIVLRLAGWLLSIGTSK